MPLLAPDKLEYQNHDRIIQSLVSGQLHERKYGKEC